MLSENKMKKIGRTVENVKNAKIDENVKRSEREKKNGNAKSG